MNHRVVVRIVLGILLSTSACQRLPAVVPSPTPIPVLTATPPPPSVLACTSTATSGLTLRGGPGQAYPAVLVLASGAQLVVWMRNEDGTWLLGQTANGSTGWVTTAFVTCNGSPSNLPMVPEPPAAATPAPVSR